MNGFTYKLEAAIFSGFDEVTLCTLVEAGRLVQFEPAEHLFNYGQAATHFFLIKKGVIDLYRPSFAGQEKVFRTLTAGDTVAETMMFINEGRYPLSAQAITASEVYRIPKSVLLELSQRTPELAMKMLENMAVTITQAVNRIDLLTMSSSQQRLVAYLLDLYAQKGSVQFTLPERQMVLARQLNIAPETFSRQMTLFRRAGFIGGLNPEVILLDITGLCDAVCLPVPKLDLKQPKPSATTLGEGLIDWCNNLK